MEIHILAHTVRCGHNQFSLGVIRHRTSFASSQTWTQFSPGTSRDRCGPQAHQTSLLSWIVWSSTRSPRIHAVPKQSLNWLSWTCARIDTNDSRYRPYLFQDWVHMRFSQRFHDSQINARGKHIIVDYQLPLVDEVPECQDQKVCSLRSGYSSLLWSFSAQSLFVAQLEGGASR